VAGVDHQGQQFVVWGIDVEQVHARRRDHHVAGAHVGHADHAFEHQPAFRLDQLALLGVGQGLDQLVSGIGAGREEFDQAFEQRALVCL
jgi:hypothetical protein